MKKIKKPQFMSEFAQFINRGNAVNLAIGVIIGAAFQAIVNSLVNDIISPVIGLFSNADFSDWVWTVKTLEDGTTVTIKYGSFITAVINFLIMAFVVFMIVKVINKLTSIGKKKEAEEVPPATRVCPYCKTEIDAEAVRCPHCTSDLTAED